MQSLLEILESDREEEWICPREQMATIANDERIYIACFLLELFDDDEVEQVVVEEAEEGRLSCLFRAVIDLLGIIHVVLRPL